MANTEGKAETFFDASHRRRLVTVSALTLTFIYLAFRLTTLGSGWLLLVSIPLLIVEVLAFSQLGLLTVQAWRIPARSASPTHVESPLCDIVIDARSADASMLERTLVGVGSVMSRAEVRVLDAREQRELADIARAFGADYVVDDRLDHSRAQTLFEHTRTELYVWLDAGQVPMPDLITRTAPRFDQPEIAVCQTAVGLLNGDSLVHIQRGRDEDALQREVLAPGLDRLGTAPWFGAASMIRREAIESIGGFPLRDVAAVDRALVRLHSHDWKSAYERQQLVRTVAPDTLDDYLRQRRRRTTEALRVFCTQDSPLRVRSLSPIQRIAHLAMASMFGSGVRQLIIIGALTTTLLTGRLPFDAELAPLVSLWAASMLLGAVARHRLSRGSMKFGDWTRQGWRTLGADLAGLAAITGRVSHDDLDSHQVHSGLRSLGRLRLLTATVVALDLALLIRAATLFHVDLLPAFTTGERIVVVTFSLVALIPMIDVLQLMVSRRQRRRTFRLPVTLDIELGDTSARTIDLATSGVGVLMGFSPAVGTITPIRLRLPEVNGTDRWMLGTAIVRAANPDPSGLVRVGLEFAHLTDEARLALVEYCMIGHAANEARERTAVQVSEPGSFDIRREEHDHRSMRALTGTAAVAGVITILAGPAAVSASEIVTTPVDQVCVTRVDGSPVTGATIDVRTDSGWELVEQTGDAGCVEVDSLPSTSQFAATNEAVRLESSPPVDEDGLVTFTLQRNTIRLLTTEGTGVNGAAVRYFTDAWRDAGSTDPAGVVFFDSLTSSVEVEVAWRGRRVVAPLASDGLDLMLARVDAGGADVAEIDRGDGWEPFHDGIQVMPGRTAVRLSDGSVVKVEVDAGHVLDVLSGTQAPVDPASPIEEEK